MGGVLQPSSPVGGKEGMDNDQVQLQKQEKISQEEAKELKQVQVEITQRVVSLALLP